MIFSLRPSGSGIDRVVFDLLKDLVCLNLLASIVISIVSVYGYVDLKH